MNERELKRENERLRDEVDTLRRELAGAPRGGGNDAGREDARYRLLVEHAPYCIHQIDTSGRVTSMNPAGLEMIGVEDERDAIGVAYMDYVSEADRPRVAELLARALDGDESHFEYVAINGRIFRSCFVPLLRSDGTDTDALMGLTVDITETRIAQDQLRRVEKLDALGKLTGGIAHDYNNMLSAILGFGELLESRLSDQSELLRYVREIMAAGGRGRALTEKMLGFSQLKSGDPEVLNVNACLNDMRDVLHAAVSSRTQVTMLLADELWVVRLDPTDLQTAMVNMAFNAVDAMEDGQGRITIETGHERLDTRAADLMHVSAGDYVVLSVSDTGSGMSDDVRARIFDPFFTMRKGPGSGLGLSQVYGFVRRSGGAIAVDSAPGTGTTFRLYFPKHEQSTGAGPDAGTDGTPGNGAAVVLAVDDEPSLLTLCEEMLTPHGYHVVTAESGAQAMEVLSHTPVDVLLTDVVMPGMDGFELAERVFDQFPDVRTLLVSGFTETDALNEHRAVQLGPIIRKPYTSASLVARIERVLAGRQI